MSYVGNTNTTQAFTPAVDYFSGNGSTVAFTLSRPVASTAQVQAVVNNVPQNPTDAFTVLNNTITFTSAPSSGTNNIYVQYTSPITQVIQPGQGTVGASQLIGGTVNTTADATLNGVSVGRGAGAVSTNTAVGASALAANTTGANNTAFGYQSANASTTVDNITAIGYQALLNNTAAYNTAVGRSALASNTSGGENVAVGGATAFANTTGTGGTAVGYTALRFNTTGASNTAIGNAALFNNTTASYNTAVGYQALYSNTTGTENVAIGPGALSAVTTGYENIGIGRGAGGSLTTAIRNTFVGDDAGYYITTGNSNTILGRYSGNQGGLDIRTASNYIVLSDGDGNPRGWHGGGIWDFNCNSYMRITQNTFNYSLLYYKNSDNVQWYTAATTGTTPDFRVVSGNNTGVYLGWTSTSWSAVSDERLKDIIEPITDAANKVSQLRAVIGKYKTDADGTRRSFLIAQDVQAVLPEAVSTTTQSVEDPTEYLGVQYTEVIPLLVAAIKEQQAMIASQSEIINAQQAALTALTARVTALESK